MKLAFPVSRQVLFLGITILAAWTGCSSSRSGGEAVGRAGVTVSLVEELRSIEALLPIAPDSIVELYRKFDTRSFYTTFGDHIQAARLLIDSLNTSLPPEFQIDTLSIDHTFENFGTAARIGKSIYLSSSYFFSFDDPAVLRSVITHEFGHIYFDRMTSAQRADLNDIWQQLQGSALFYLFRDGEYSGNARFGGHPDESPTELFASAFNLFSNKEDELFARFRYIEPKHTELVLRLQRLAKEVTLWQEPQRHGDDNK